MKMFKSKSVAKDNDVRYCKNKKCRCELRKNNDGDYCNNCQTKRDERRDRIVGGAGAIFLTVLMTVINPKKIINKILGGD